MLPSFLPHARKKIEQAFQEWQQTVASQTSFFISESTNEQNSLVNIVHTKKMGCSYGFDTKQPFRPEKRYRRR